jgi:hypothetical protein
MMLEIKAWRIYYADGSTFDSTMGRWADAPAFGVQCVVYYHVPPYKTLDGPADGVYTYLGEEGYEGIKMGLWMDAEGYYRIANLAEKSVMPEAK